MSRYRHGGSGHASVDSRLADPVASHPQSGPSREGEDASGKGLSVSDGRPGGWPAGRAGLVTGVGLCVLVLLLGVVAKLGPVAALDLRIDRHIAIHDRTSAFTSLAKFATTIATPETVGVGLMILVPVVLLLFRRRLDAAKAFCMFAGAFALAEVGKVVIDEHRPPVSVQAVAADSSPSFPSGHATTAAVMAVALVVIVATTIAWRMVALVIGVLYALAVATSRVYLGDHYPLDVLGGMICALAAGFVVTGLFALPAVRPYLVRFKLVRS